MSVQIIIPDVRGSVRTAVPDWYGPPAVPQFFWWPKQKVSAVCRSLKECGDLVAWFDGRPNFCPDQPVLLMIPNVNPPVLISGMGFATAAELRDCALEAWAVKSKRMEKLGEVMDFDSLREQHGDVRREDAPAAIAEAFAERIRRHKASPVTDPWKQFKYPNPTQKVVFPQQPDNSSWKVSNDN